MKNVYGADETEDFGISDLFTVTVANFGINVPSPIYSFTRK